MLFFFGYWTSIGMEILQKNVVVFWPVDFYRSRLLSVWIRYVSMFYRNITLFENLVQQKVYERSITQHVRCFISKHNNEENTVVGHKKESNEGSYFNNLSQTKKRFFDPQRK